MTESRALARELEPATTNQMAHGQGIHYAAPDEESGHGIVSQTARQTIQADPFSLYHLWRDLGNIPTWQEHVVSVTDLGAGKSHWIMGDPGDADGKRAEFDSQIVNDEVGKTISWESITPGILQSGTVTFHSTASNRGTLVTLTQSVKVPGGSLGNALAAVVERSPRQTVIEDLRHFKQLAEAGEVPSVKEQPHGPRGVMGSFKEWLYGEINPTPSGTRTETGGNEHNNQMKTK